MKKRILSILLMCCMALTMLPTAAFAEAGETGTLSPAASGPCEHHPEHDEACGYTEGTEDAAETPCGHVCEICKSDDGSTAPADPAGVSGDTASKTLIGSVRPAATQYTYTLHYNANGGSGAPPSQSMTSSNLQVSFLISDKIPTRDGYTFKAWADSPTGKPIYLRADGYYWYCNVVNGQTNSKTLYAIWEAHTHSWGEWTSNKNGTHTRTCTLDSSHTETGSCSGGKATSTERAVCETCHAAYGELLQPAQTLASVNITFPMPEAGKAAGDGSAASANADSGLTLYMFGPSLWRQDGNHKKLSAEDIYAENSTYLLNFTFYTQKPITETTSVTFNGESVALYTDKQEFNSALSAYDGAGNTNLAYVMFSAEGTGDPSMGDLKDLYLLSLYAFVRVPEYTVREQFSLAPGGVYYFDLSGAGIPGTANGSLPDTSLHYVPFTYAGTVAAYKLTSTMAATDEYAQQNKYAHSLFIADHAVTHTTSWDELNTAGLIFGKGYASGGIDYTMRVPSAGSASKGPSASVRGNPQSNEWDMIMNKDEGYVKNWSNMFSWGQDNAKYAPTYRAVRGYNSARHWTNYSSAINNYTILGFRPVLEVLNSDALDSDGLKAVALDLGGGKLGGSSDAIQIIVKSGGNFTAPASDGLSRPDGNTGSYFKWLGSDGKLYAPGDNVSADVTKLTAQFEPGVHAITITTDTLPNGKVGEAYSQTLAADSTAPITWSIDSGALPAGLSLNADTGKISGTPAAEGTASFTVKAASSAGSDTKELSITIDKASPSAEDLVDPVIRIIPYGEVGYPAQSGTRTAADFFKPGEMPEGAKITAITPPASASVLDSISVDGNGTLSYAKDISITGTVFKSEAYTVTITGDNCAPISAPLTVRQYLDAGFQGPIHFGYYLYGDTYTYTCQVTNPGENGVWSALIRNPDIFEIYQETTDITSEPGKSIYTVQIRAIKASAGVTCIDFLYFSDTTMASPKDSSTGITGGDVSTRPLTVTAGSASITKGDALPTDLVTCSGLLDSEGRRDDRDTVLENALSYRLLDASGVEVAADTARNTPGTYTVVPAAALKSGWDERYALSRVNGTLTVEDKVEFTVTVTNDGNGKASALPAKAVAETEITLTAAPNEGYHFKEWQVVSGGVTIANNKFTMPSCNVEVKAIFEEDAPPAPTEYTITFDGNGGTPSVGSMTTAKQKLSSLPSASRSGSYSFDGWYTEKSGGTKITMDTVFSANTTVYAHWTYTGGGGGWYYSYYTIKATAGAGGSISPSGNISVREGRDQTFTITPDKGYAVSNVKIDGKSIGAVKSYTFENVSRTHTIEVIFMKANGTPQTGVFVDVATGSYYEDAVDWAVENGITQGTDDTLFSPDGICTRAQAVTFLWRTAGSPEPETRTMPFTDVPVGSYYYDAVLWAVENGITKGTSDTTFSPNMTCSRAQIITFLWRSEKSPAAGTANPFADVKSTAYYADAVLWAVKEDITKGTTNTTFSPDADCTRAQIVTFLWRCKK